jgi:hypothetical protein
MSDIFTLNKRVRLIPVIHGSGNFSREIGKILLQSTCDCLAVSLPPEFQSSVENGIHKLPYISVSCQQENGGAFSYVPVDPCQPIIVALRIAMQEGIHRAYIDRTVSSFHPRITNFPDTYALNTLPLEKFCAALLPSIKRPPAQSQSDKRARWMAHRLHALAVDFSHVVCVCSILDWPWIRAAFNERAQYDAPEPPPSNPVLYGVEKKTLLFALSEFPYITYLYEKKRGELKSDRALSIDGVKEILLRAREIYLSKHKIKFHNLSAQTFQIHLQYLRNLCLLDHRLTPDLYTLVSTAKQIGGDPFALAVLASARDYPFQDEKSGLDTLTMGIEKALFDETPAQMKNRLSESQYEWRNLKLKTEPERDKETQWQHTWNPYGQCSWPPEDDVIESFHTHVREQSKILLCNDLARSEKFTSSVKDGIDIRETLRNLHTGDLYVKEIPPSRGAVEIVVFLFDCDPTPERYPWRQTWYAEHMAESTLCFFATDFQSQMVGPGVAQSIYGGCMMIFPPRPIPNIWEDPRLQYSDTLDEKLLEAAFFHSHEKHVTVVAPCLPKMTWRRLAKQYKKRMIHIPMKRFSNQTLQKIRRFHVLNGKDIRTFAGRFIQEL